MTRLSRIASTKSTVEFIAAAAGVDIAASLPSGQSLLMAALSNPDLDSRYASTQWLIDHGCCLGRPDSTGYTELHILFGQVMHDIPSDFALAKQMIALGADVNAVSSRRGLVFCEVLRMNYLDEDLEPFYNLWFAQPVTLDFDSPSALGATPRTLARAVPYRASILERMENYVAEHA